MSRIRTLKPEILEDANTAALSDGAYRLFIALIVLADDYGNVRADDRWLQGQIWWARENPPRVAEFLREVSDARIAVIYTVRGQTYAHVAGWDKHQRIDNAGKARVPKPNDAEAQGFDFGASASIGDSPKSSAKFREIPLDPDHRPPTTTPSTDKETAANRGDQPLSLVAESPGLKAVKAKVDKATRRVSVGPMPTDWTPNPTAIAKARDLGLDLRATAEHFQNHHTAKGSRFANWDAAFLTWLGNAQRFGGAPARANSRNDPTATALESLRQAEAREIDDAPHAAEAAP
jgi:hypothetical protein